MTFVLDTSLLDAWVRVTRINRRIGVPFPNPESDAESLGEWIGWWLPAFHAADYLAPGAIELLAHAGWWPPVVARSSAPAPEVVIEASSRIWTDYWQSRRRMDDRTRTLHTAMAVRLAEQPERISEAIEISTTNSAELRALCKPDEATGAPGPDPHGDWVKILNYPIEHVLKTMIYDSERMDFLRPFSPFYAMHLIDQDLRNRIFAMFVKPSKEKLDELDELDRLANLVARKGSYQ